MIKPIIQFYDLETQEEIVREMNDAEYAQHLIDVAVQEQELAKQAEAKALEDAKKAAKAQALTALGLSQEVINLLAE